MNFNEIQNESGKFFLVTITCLNWMCLFEITNLYDYVYQCFNMNLRKSVYTTGYVIMPDQLMSLVYSKNKHISVKDIFSETKRFLAYEIVKRLKKLGRYDILEMLHESVSVFDANKGQLHNVFHFSCEIENLVSDYIFRKKLYYIHTKPVSGKWKLSDNYTDYIHSSAKFYESGLEGIYKVVHFKEVSKIPAGFSCKLNIRL